MSINRVTLASFTSKDARSRPTKRHKDAQQQWHGKTQSHNCVAFGAAAEYCSRIQTGAHVFLEGELIYQEYERTVETK
jgi:single-stranded DNA-binding protein